MTADNPTRQAPSQVVTTETGRMGRVAYARIAPNEDLVQGIEKMCLAEGFENAFVRGGLGSLVDACLGTLDGGYQQVTGPAVEVVSMAGEVRSTESGTPVASLAGIVADTDGNVYGGPFLAGWNPVCMTFEVTLEEWLPDNPDTA
ncbi:PCC domain-containing protein [Vreelandella arcis]|uniref:Predicted DNA-binding protein with PD1-like DNA-binding motif n=1 Tax=Vreelandella arcis TaxID=416873 RepID=A0A1H0GZ32_9GAMM|nr:PPC domain-containing DNA-binding protein [Halomonas arcis]SDO12145.1 Predicted DNA-binding protein with PD1-like DNA-binding motif [Halomonas arcis]